MNVSLRHLRAFVAIAQAESFTIAAGVLCLTQSTLTKTIRELEAAVDLPLFVRTTRNVSLTAHGAAFLPAAQRLLNDFDMSLKALREESIGNSGNIRIASGMAFASTVLPAVIGVLNRRYPKIRIHLVDDTSGGVIRRIASGEVDFGIGSYVGAAMNVLSARRLLTARLGVLFPPPATHLSLRV